MEASPAFIRIAAEHGVGAGSRRAAAGASQQRSKKPRLPFMIALLTALPVFILAPAGPLLQKTLTTSAEQGDQRVTRVASTRLRESFLHKINTGR